ncbi:MAG: hypothetical protein MRY79_02955, partial [Alphaproteobacteria bacterium]|nr:hypothetical protein [Alphaproteobacteria bacterium]
MTKTSDRIKAFAIAAGAIAVGFGVASSLSWNFGVVSMGVGTLVVLGAGERDQASGVGSLGALKAV